MGGSGGDGGGSEDCGGGIDRDENGLGTSEENWNMPIELSGPKVGRFKGKMC